MEKVLSQSEIDTLFRAAQGAPASNAAPAVEVVVEPWNLHQAGILGKEQVHSLSELHEGFARNLTTSVGGYLRDKFEVVLVSAEQLAYRDFLARNTGVTYYSSFRLLPGEVSGILQIDLGLAFPIVDLLLGGPGGMPQEAREVTEIEETILEGVGQVICRELETAWRPLGLQVKFEQRQPPAQLLRVMPAPEKTLTLTFEAGMTDARGTFSIAFPAVVSSALLRKLAAELLGQRPRGPALRQESIRKRLLDAALELELGTPAVQVKLMDLLSMRPAGVLPLRCPIDQPSTVRVKGRDCWSARAVRSGANRRAAQLLERTMQPEEEES